MRERPWRYILAPDGKTPVPCDDLLRWGDWYETGNRAVAWTGNDAKHVSTIFLGIDHNFSFEGSPVLFETMTFINGVPADSPPGEFWDARYSTWEHAMAGHERIVARVFKRVGVK